MQDATCFDYIEMSYNPKRKHTNNGMLSPVDFEERQLKQEKAGVSETRSASVLHKLVDRVTWSHITATRVYDWQFFEGSRLCELFFTFFDPGRRRGAQLKGSVFAQQSLSAPPNCNLSEPRDGPVFPLALDDATHGVTPRGFCYDICCKPCRK